MPTLEEIQGQIKSLDGVKEFLGKKEIKELPNILWEGEKLEKLAQGIYNGGFGVVVATNRRVIFVDKGIIKFRVEDFPYDKITSIQYETGFLQGKITIFASGNKAVIDNISKDIARTFAEYIRAKISGNKNTTDPLASIDTEDIVSKIERLAKLKKQGTISEDEFAALKKKIVES